MTGAKIEIREGDIDPKTSLPTGSLCEEPEILFDHPDKQERRHTSPFLPGWEFKHGGGPASPVRVIQDYEKEIPVLPGHVAVFRTEDKIVVITHYPITHY